MYLKELTVNGFKSFAKKSDLEFSAPITAIVGPNGSGKSNVAESFRFVLGEQSPTKMRSKKGEDMIWGGSDHVSRGNRASVSVVLDNKRKIFPIDYEEIRLERVVHRDGENEYLINGSRVKLRDVQEILAAANIGPSGHHIISQGEADRILSASPKERREMVEDALGLKAFQFKKAEADKKLDKTNANIEKVESLRREVAPHLRFLEKQVKKLERAAEERGRLRQLYAEYLKREDVYLRHWDDTLKSQLKPLKHDLDKSESSLQKARNVLDQKGDEINRQKLQMAEKEWQTARDSHQQALRDLGVIEGQIAFMERQLKSVSAAKDTAVTISGPELEKLVASLEKEVETAVKSEDVTLLRRTLQDIVRGLRKFLSHDSKGSGADTLASLREEHASLLHQKISLDKTVATVEQEEMAAEKAYRQVQLTIESDQSQNREAEREVFRLINDSRELEAKINQLELERQTLSRDQDDFKRELQEAVALIGRQATDYLSFNLAEKEILGEERGAQIERRRQLEKLKIRIEEFGGANDELEKEYQNVKERDDFLVHELQDLRNSVEKLGELIAELEQELEERFVTGLDKIGLEFNRFFTLMFGGGKAELTKVRTDKKKREADLTDEESVSPDEIVEKGESGIDISVSLPNKRVKNLDMLSGGERALTSIALIFAMSQVNPPLFVILDETDAALDEANSRRYGDMIEALAKKSQLILITHNRETMSRAGILYGVTMGGDGVSKLLSVRLTEALAVAK